MVEPQRTYLARVGHIHHAAALASPPPEAVEEDRSNPRAELILAGRYDEAEVDPPRYPQRDVVILGQRIIDGAKRPVRFPDPIHIARKYSIDVLDRVPLGAGVECCDGTCIWYRWHPSARTRGSRIFHGLAHCCFDLAGWSKHTEADAVHLAAELAFQTEFVREARTLRRAMAKQPHADEWLIRAQMRRARLILAR